MLLPSALGFSPHPPVSVYGTGTLQTIAAFLDAWLTHFPTLVRSASRFWIATRFFLCDSSFACPGIPFPGCAFHTCPHSSVLTQYRNLNLLSIGYVFRPRLRSRLTQADQLYPGNLRYSAIRILTLFSLLIPAFSLQYSPQLLSVLLLPVFNAPLPMYYYIPQLRCRVLAPDIFGAGPLDQ